MLNEITTVKYRNFIWKIRDVWYERFPVYKDTDIVYYMQCDTPFGNEWYEQYTILIDLKKAVNELFQGISPTTRNEIKTFESQRNFIYFFYDKPTLLQVKQFINDYKNFAQNNKLPLADESRLQNYLKNNHLLITKLEGNSDQRIWHVYRSNLNRSALLYSISISFGIDKKIEIQWKSKANRYCHWRDMLELKKLGVNIYDFGGWYKGVSDKKLLNINAFKEKFGGKVIENYNCIVYPTIKGLLFFKLKRLKSLFIKPAK